MKVVSDTVLDMINAACYDKPFIFIRAIRLSLSRLFLTLYYILDMINAAYHDKQPSIL